MHWGREAYRRSKLSPYTGVTALATSAHKGEAWPCDEVQQKEARDPQGKGGGARHMTGGRNTPLTPDQNMHEQRTSG